MMPISMKPVFDYIAYLEMMKDPKFLVGYWFGLGEWIVRVGFGLMQGKHLNK